MDQLDEIMAWKHREIAPRIRPVSERELSRFAAKKCYGPTFYEALAQSDHLSVIAEIKRRSPSAGGIAPAVDASEQARLYYNAGTDAISVLTDEKYFAGSLCDLWEVNDFLQTRDDAPPTLRKDFFIHPIQVVEAAEAGARAILIIVRALIDETEKNAIFSIRALYDAANLAGLDSLFEVHSEFEIEIALEVGAKIIGVNNRDLSCFTTDLAISEKLIPQIPGGIVTISESGIMTLEDAVRARHAGADAVLVGEVLMRAEDPEKFIKDIQRI